MENKRVVRLVVIMVVVALVVALGYWIGPVAFDALLAMHGL